MPPFSFRKRRRSSSPSQSTPQPQRRAPSARTKNKPTLLAAIDASNSGKKSVDENRKLLAHAIDEDDDESSLSDLESDLESDEFENVQPSAKRRKQSPQAEDDNAGDDEDEMDWEDAIATTAPSGDVSQEQEIGDVSISLDAGGSYIEPLVSMGAVKKGPSKRERQTRIQAHCLHVQTLLWHNTIRNSWVNDREVQNLLVDALPDGANREVQRWREAMGMLSKEELLNKKQSTMAKNKTRKGTRDKVSGRDWNYDAQHAEPGAPNASSGDPLLRLLKVLAAYWRKRFVVTRPGLHKEGYKSLRRLRNEIKDWERDPTDFEEHGERIENVKHFRQVAAKCEGSRDVGAQLFASLLRGLGLDTRLVANLQPIGFGWSKTEEADAPGSKKKRDTIADPREDSPEVTAPVQATRSRPLNGKGKQKANSTAVDGKARRKSSSTSDDTSAEASEDAASDDPSVVDITPSTSRKRPTKKFDREKPYPNYWVEVCSPVTHKYIPVDPIVLSTITSNDELLQTFEPRGKKAEQAKQVMAYTIGFSSDGTAKDITVRYLKRHQLPGKTKGMRMPVEKVPIYNYKGKVKRYEEFDWLRGVLSLYDRPEKKRTMADDVEDQTDLKPFKPGKLASGAEKESLQWYKSSAEFVLEQHLRREEALRPGSQPVKTFVAGKGDKGKEHPVHLRADVLTCRTVESWHKEGRAVKLGEQPIKYVPMRAVTLVRKREIEDAQRETGEKLQQGLYSREQTDWIIPDPIENGVIPKNAYNNMDVFVDTMVPRGAVHVPLKGTAKLCRALGIDYAEACTGFEFGKQRAVPVLTGVVVADANEQMVRDAWHEDQKEIRRKEDTKRRAAALHWWRKMLLSLRVFERMRAEYSNRPKGGEESNPFVRVKGGKGSYGVGVRAEGDFAEDGGGGGFFPDHDDGEHEQDQAGVHRRGPGDELAVDADHDATGGGFLIDDQDQSIAPDAAEQPISLQSMHAKAKSNERGAARERHSAAVTRGPSKISPPSQHRQVSSPSNAEEADQQGATPPRASRGSRRNARSPRVVVKSSRGKSKRAPVKSKYFARAGEQDDDQSDGNSDSDSEAEVVRPRQTTTRTRGRA